MNGLLVSGQTAGENCQIEIGFEPELKNYKHPYPYPSNTIKYNTIKHSLESSEPGSFRLTLIVLIVQLNKFI